MPSPFPGMDPYMEAYWGDLHTGLCCGISSSLQPALRAIGLRARATEAVWVPRDPDQGVRTARWIKVIDIVRRDRVVTVIEMPTPDDKAAGVWGRRYRRRLRRHLAGGANVVEIDLFRSPHTGPGKLPPDRRTTYGARVNRAVDPDLWAAYPMPLRDPLPTVPVPCRAGETELPLALQPIIDRIYDEGGYDSTDYTVPARPPLAGDDAAWAAARIAARRPA